MVGHGIDSPGSGEGKKRALVKTLMKVKIPCNAWNSFTCPGLHTLSLTGGYVLKEGSNLVTETKVIVGEASKERGAWGAYCCLSKGS